MQRPCERLIEINAQREWAEAQINEQGNRMANACNEMIVRGVPAHLVRRDFSEYMAKVVRHYMPIVQTSIPRIQLVFSLEA